MKSVSKKILIINGSLGGAIGNSNVLINHAIENLKTHSALYEIIHLKNNHNDIEAKLKWADGFLFVSGTYWDSWGSPLQLFLEKSTEYEATDLFLFKPASVIITMHSVGGKAILSRLQGVLNTMGMLIPPMSGFVYSLATHLNLKKEHHEEDLSFNDDFWNLEDIEIVIHNLMTAVNHKHTYKSWPVDRKDPNRRWI